MAQSNQRLAVDLDEIERQLRHSQAPVEAPKPDPLAELARIVGHDDPFRAGGRERPGAAPGARVPGALVGPAKQGGARAYPASSEPRPSDDLFPDYSAYSSEADDADPGYAAPSHAFAAQDDFRPLEKRGSRKGLITVGVILGTAALGVGGALLWRNTPKMATNGEPPVVRADREPLKVQPENPGGVDIPNQDAQVYDRAAKDGQTRVVNREEQPLDVQQAARSMQGSGTSIRPSPQIPPGAATPGTPLASTAPQLAANPATAGLGEPRRVRTVSVRPDGTFVAADQRAAASPPPAAASSSANVSPPAAPTSSATPSTTPQASAAPQKPKVEARSASQATSAPSAPSSATASDEIAPVQISPGLTRQPQRPQRAAAAAPAVAPSEPVETTSAAGGFAVQIGVMPTEQEARTQFEQLRRKFASELGGRPPLVRAAEVNGKTIYRVRVGPMSQADATALCTKLKAAGGNCFVARN
jgi:hypothetical protein